MSIERVQHATPERAVDQEVITHWARRFAASPLLPRNLVVFARDASGKATKTPDIDATALAVELVALKGAALGIEPAIAIQAFDVIDGSVVPTAKTMLAAVEKAGYRIWWPEYGSERVTVAARMPGASADEVTKVTFTMDDARRAGLLDEWYEKWERAESGKSYLSRWVVGSTEETPAWVKKLQAAGEKPRRRENWWKWPIDMLVARASVRLGRLLATFEMSGGIRKAVEVLEQAEKAEDFDSPVPASAPRDDDHPLIADVHGEFIADAEIVADQRTPDEGSAPPASAPTPPAPSPLDIEVRTMCADLGLDQEHRRAVWTFALGRPIDSTKGATPEEYRAVLDVLQRIEAGDAEVVNGPDGWVVEGWAA